MILHHVGAGALNLRMVSIASTLFLSLSCGAPHAESIKMNEIEVQGRLLTAQGQLDAASGEAWLPLHAVVEALGGHVTPLPERRGLIVCTEKSCMPFTGKYLRGEGSAALAPARRLARALAAEVNWNPERRKVSLQRGDGLSSGEGPGQGLSPGSLVPEVTLADLDGKPISLGAFRGKKTLLYMWASW